MSSDLINEKIKWLEASEDLKDSKPAMPVREILDEAENLYEWCQKDKAELLKVSRDWQLVEDIPVRAGALRKTHAIWNTEYKSLKDSKKQWKAASGKAKTLRKKLEHYLSFVLRDLPGEYAKVRKIKEGYSNADMIQDLSVLAELGQLHKEKLESVGMDLKLLDLARSESNDLLDLLGEANSSAHDSQPAFELRNKAYHHLKQAVDEIRRRGKFALQDDHDRLKGYYSNYIKRMNQRSKKIRLNPGNDQ